MDKLSARRKKQETESLSSAMTLSGAHSAPCETYRATLRGVVSKHSKALPFGVAAKGVARILR